MRQAKNNFLRTLHYYAYLNNLPESAVVGNFAEYAKQLIAFLKSTYHIYSPSDTVKQNGVAQSTVHTIIVHVFVMVSNSAEQRVFGSPYHAWAGLGWVTRDGLLATISLE